MKNKTYFTRFHCAQCFLEIKKRYTYIHNEINNNNTVAIPEEVHFYHASGVFSSIFIYIHILLCLNLYKVVHIAGV